jgi:hypothetical protein
VINDVLYDLPAQTIPLDGGATATVRESEINHRAALWGIIEASYDMFDWLSLGLGVSTYHPELLPDSSGYYAPFFNRYANLYLSASIPVEKFVDRVIAWTGKGAGSGASRADK